MGTESPEVTGKDNMAQVHLSDFPEDLYQRARALAEQESEKLHAKVFLKAWFTRAIQKEVEREEKAGK